MVEKKFESECFYVNKEEQLLITKSNFKNVFQLEALSKETEKAAEKMNLDHSIWEVISRGRNCFKTIHYSKKSQY